MQDAQLPPELLAYKALQAVHRGNAEELAKLIEAGANAHVINAVVKTSPNGRPDREGRGGLLYHAVEKENVELVKVLLGNGAEVNGSKQDESPPPLRAAVVRKNIDLVTMLLKRGANVNRKYALTTTSGKVTTTVLFETTSDVIFGVLLRRGCDVNFKDSKDDTPLHVHATNWNASFVKGLVEYGADVDALDKEHRTPLMRAIQQWDFQSGFDKEANCIEVCHILMSHKAVAPLADSIVTTSENSEQLLRRLQIVKEWATQRNLGMLALSHVPLEIYRQGVAEIAAFFAANTVVPVTADQKNMPIEASHRQIKPGLNAWTPGEETLQRKVEILPALDRAPSFQTHSLSNDAIIPFPGRHDSDSSMDRRPSKSAWVLQETIVPLHQLSVLSEQRMSHGGSFMNDAIAGIPQEDVEKAVSCASPVLSSDVSTVAKSVPTALMDPERRSSDVARESVHEPVTGIKAALPPVSTRSGRPLMAALQLYRLKILCATNLRRVLKYRRQSPYCICQLIRGDGEVLMQVQTSVHPGGGQIPTWKNQVFELALTPENTRTCTMVFILKHSGVMTSLDERIAVGMMPFPYLPMGHTLDHQLLLMNNETLAGHLEIRLEAYSREQ